MGGSASTSGGSKGGGLGGARLPPLLLDQTEARRAEKVFFKTAPPLSQGLGDSPHTPPPPSPSEALDPSLSTQAIEAWKVKCMTFQVFHDLYIDLM